MSVFVEMMDGKPVMAYYTREDAAHATEKDLIEVPLVPLSVTVKRYFDFRHLKSPNANDAFLFLASEIGELADELAQRAGGWVRNHPEAKGRGISGEVGDVLMMLLVFCMSVTHEQKRYLDPIQAMFDKLASKGFPISASRQSFAAGETNATQENHPLRESE